MLYVLYTVHKPMRIINEDMKILINLSLDLSLPFNVCGSVGNIFMNFNEIQINTP